MPIAPQFHIEHIRDFAMQVSRAPEAVRRKQMAAAESLLKEIEEESLYPFDYVLFRVTGYRVDKLEQPMLPGSALISDLVAFIVIVSRTLRLQGDGTLDVIQASKKLGVSLRTLSRLRKEGLVFHWVLDRNGKFRLGISQQSLDNFTSRHKNRILKASKFSRLSKGEKKYLVDLALQYKGKEKTLSEVAAGLAKHSNRGLETIRTLLQQSERTRSTFNQPRVLSRNDARDIEKQIRNGVSWEQLTRQYQRTTGAIRKTLARLRATRLKQLKIPFVELDIFSRSDAQDIIFGTPAVQRVAPPMLVFDIRQEFASLDNAEVPVVSAMHLLRRRSSLMIKTLGYTPTEKLLDRIETDLRWSFLLQQKVILEAMPSSLAVAVQHAGRQLHELPEKRALTFLQEIIQIVSEVCSTLDPSKGQVAAKTPASVLDRNLPFIDATSEPHKASALKHKIQIDHPFHHSVPWSFLIPNHDLPESAMQISDELQTIVSLRYGWAGKPRTVQEIGVEVGRSANWISRQLRNWP